MGIYFWEGKPLFVAGGIALHEDCCCGCCSICELRLLEIYDEVAHVFHDQTIWTLAENQTIDLYTNFEEACTACDPAENEPIYSFTVDGTIYYVCAANDVDSLLWEVSWHSSLNNIDCWVSTVAPVTAANPVSLMLKCGGPTEAEAKDCKEFLFKPPEITPEEIECEPLWVWEAVYDCSTELWTVTKIEEADLEAEPSLWELVPEAACIYRRIWVDDQPAPPDVEITCYYHWEATSEWEGAWSVSLLIASCENEWLPTYPVGEGWLCSEDLPGCVCRRVTTSPIPPAEPEESCAGVYLWEASYNCLICEWVIGIGVLTPVLPSIEPDADWTHISDCYFQRHWTYSEPPPPVVDIYYVWSATAAFGGAWSLAGEHDCYCVTNPHAGLGLNQWHITEHEESCSALQITTTCVPPSVPEEPCTGCNECLEASLPGEDAWNLTGFTGYTFVSNGMACAACDGATEGYYKFTLNGTTYYQCADSLAELSLNLSAEVVVGRCSWVGLFSYSHSEKTGHWYIYSNEILCDVVAATLNLGEVFVKCEEQPLFHYTVEYTCPDCVGWGTVIKGVEAEGAVDPTPWAPDIANPCLFHKIDYDDADPELPTTPNCYQVWEASSNWGGAWSVSLAIESCNPDIKSSYSIQNFNAWENCVDDPNTNCSCYMATYTQGCWAGSAPSPPDYECDPCTFCPDTLAGLEGDIAWQVGWESMPFTDHESACAMCDWMSGDYTKFTFDGQTWYACGNVEDNTLYLEFYGYLSTGTCVMHGWYQYGWQGNIVNEWWLESYVGGVYTVCEIITGPIPPYTLGEVSVCPCKVCLNQLDVITSSAWPYVFNDNTTVWTPVTNVYLTEAEALLECDPGDVCSFEWGSSVYYVCADTFLSNVGWMLNWVGDEGCVLENEEAWPTTNNTDTATLVVADFHEEGSDLFCDDWISVRAPDPNREFCDKESVGEVVAYANVTVTGNHGWGHDTIVVNDIPLTYSLPNSGPTTSGSGLFYHSPGYLFGQVGVTISRVGCETTIRVRSIISQVCGWGGVANNVREVHKDYTLDGNCHPSTGSFSNGNTGGYEQNCQNTHVIHYDPNICTFHVEIYTSS